MDNQHIIRYLRRGAAIASLVLASCAGAQSAEPEEPEPVTAQPEEFLQRVEQARATFVATRDALDIANIIEITGREDNTSAIETAIGQLEEMYRQTETISSREDRTRYMDRIRVSGEARSEINLAARMLLIFNRANLGSGHIDQDAPGVMEHYQERRISLATLIGRTHGYGARESIITMAHDSTDFSPAQSQELGARAGATWNLLGHMADSMPFEGPIPEQTYTLLEFMADIAEDPHASCEVAEDTRYRVHFASMNLLHYSTPGASLIQRYHPSPAEYDRLITLLERTEEAYDCSPPPCGRSSGPEA